MINSNSLLGNGHSLVTDVDTIQEATDILISDSAGLVDQSTGLRDIFKRVTLNVELSVIFFIFFDGDTFTGIDLSNKFFSNKVLDFDDFFVGMNEKIDGEMGRGKSHLELVTLSNTSDHILNVRENSCNNTLLLSGTKPHYFK